MATLYGIYIRELRARKNITMKQLASSLGVSPSYLSSLENGKKGIPNNVLLEKISSFFNLNEKQNKKLFQSAQYSQRTLKLPADLDPDVFRIGNIFVERAPFLSHYQLELIEKVLGEIPTN